MGKYRILVEHVWGLKGSKGQHSRQNGQNLQQLRHVLKYESWLNVYRNTIAVAQCYDVDHQNCCLFSKRFNFRHCRPNKLNVEFY